MLPHRPLSVLLFHLLPVLLGVANTLCSVCIAERPLLLLQNREWLLRVREFVRLSYWWMMFGRLPLCTERRQVLHQVSRLVVVVVAHLRIPQSWPEHENGKLWWFVSWLILHIQNAFGRRRTFSSQQIFDVLCDDDSKAFVYITYIPIRSCDSYIKKSRRHPQAFQVEHNILCN